MGCGDRGAWGQFVLGPKDLAVDFVQRALSKEGHSQVWVPESSLWLPWLGGKDGEAKCGADGEP